ERLGALLFNTGRRLGGAHFVLARPAALALRRGRRGRVIRVPAGFLACLDLGGVACDVTDDVAMQMMPDQLLVHPVEQILGGELGERAREGCLAGDVRAAFPAADASQAAVDVQTLDERCGGWQV